MKLSLVTIVDGIFGSAETLYCINVSAKDPKNPSAPVTCERFL